MKMRNEFENHWRKEFFPDIIKSYHSSLDKWKSTLRIESDVCKYLNSGIKI